MSNKSFMSFHLKKKCKKKSHFI